MAVKAKETVHNDQLTTRASLSICALIIIFVVFYQVVSRGNYLSSEQLSAISASVCAIMIVGIILMLRYMNTIYNLLVTHARLEIERRVTFVKHIVAEIPIANIITLCPKAEFSESDKITGKKQKFTVAPRDTKTFQIYAMLYLGDDGKTNFAELQCSKKMYRTLTKMMNQKQK